MKVTMGMVTCIMDSLGITSSAEYFQILLTVTLFLALSMIKLQWLSCSNQAKVLVDSFNEVCYPILHIKTKILSHMAEY